MRPKVKTLGEGIKYVCDMCGQVFARPDNYRRHRIQKHGITGGKSVVSTEWQWQSTNY